MADNNIGSTLNDFELMEIIGYTKKWTIFGSVFSFVCNDSIPAVACFV